MLAALLSSASTHVGKEEFNVDYNACLLLRVIQNTNIDCLQRGSEVVLQQAERRCKRDNQMQMKPDHINGNLEIRKYIYFLVFVKSAVLLIFKSLDKDTQTWE